MVLRPINAVLFVLLLCVVDNVCCENHVGEETTLSGYLEGNSQIGCISKTHISCGVIKDIDEGHEVVNLTGGLDDDIREGLKDYIKDSQAEVVTTLPGTLVNQITRGLTSFIQFVLAIINPNPVLGGGDGGNNQGGTGGGGVGGNNQGGTGGGLR
ncbi:unnamed protein product [Lactuca saligna]|uniref:Uncharacterized protein n=1 Tax=Lactuca saligna TaxID=75948 RepID=A0AA35Y797_LACSI|nr:unnamed protein product [Lactuca saligna]